ncbi:HET-domain-containing protein [Acephala macrosclerotiorum]|nr:HET-domain-containing protein [Acephala macrosclerotiorum]
MSSYQYSSLPPEGDTIRLLRLLPNEDEAAPLQCELCNYSLQKLGPRTHLYEALSYVWGSPHVTRPIYLGKNLFSVTVNLHAALLRLRDHSFERIIWVDAICINQKNPEEQGQQVQLMAKIYSNAHRVIVWLGEKTEDTNGALQDICLAANGKSTEHSKKNTILNLLERPWFQRIWVLQEVAAARHVVMIALLCSFSEIAEPPFTIHLIERAGIRSTYTTNSPERFSLEIGRLVELVDMFHTREASDARDKVYALLGMAFDDLSKAGLQPDYNIPWNKLFQKLVKFVLGKDISVETSDNNQRAVIKSKGCILGQVSSVRSGDRQNVNITLSEDSVQHLGKKMEWILQASAKSIRKGDIVCLLQGISKPTIIRQCKDHFRVVIIAAIPLDKDGSVEVLNLFKSIARFPRDLLLVWDWETPLGESQDQEEYKALEKDIQLKHSKAEFGDHSDKATRIWNVALVLGDLEEYGKADEKLREAIEMLIGEEPPHTLTNQYGITPLLWAAGNGYDAAVELLLAKDGVDADLKDSQYNQTPLLWAAKRGHEAVVKLLLNTGKVEVDSKDKGDQLEG